ncbi:helix-turn-helix domain-containing protein [Salibacteraceae bacterium]|nr:helix-turn-helix domain-containing protein [Salibacteraceae bacterium]
MHHIPENLKSIRKNKGWTQGEMAKHLGVKRSAIGAYEEGRADPRISFIQLICDTFDLSIDQLINAPIDQSGQKKTKDISGRSLRVLPIVIDATTDKECATLVPVKAAAGYLNGYGDVEFIEQLPTFALPFPELSKGRTYRLFSIQGDSMLPIKSGSYVICSYEMDWANVKNDELYVVVTLEDGIVFKRVLNNLREGKVTLKSDNSEYKSYEVLVSEVLEIWKVHGVAHFDLEQTFGKGESQPMSKEFTALHQRLERIEARLNN